MFSGVALAGAGVAIRVPRSQVGVEPAGVEEAVGVEGDAFKPLVDALRSGADTGANASRRPCRRRGTAVAWPPTARRGLAQRAPARRAGAPPSAAPPPHSTSCSPGRARGGGGLRHGQAPQRGATLHRAVAAPMKNSSLMVPQALPEAGGQRCASTGSPPSRAPGPHCTAARRAGQAQHQHAVPPGAGVTAAGAGRPTVLSLT